MIKNMTVLLPHLEKSDDSTRVGCRLALNGCFITVGDRCREHPAAIRACCGGALSKPTKRDSEAAENVGWAICVRLGTTGLTLHSGRPTGTWLGLASRNRHAPGKKPLLHPDSQPETETLVVIHHVSGRERHCSWKVQPKLSDVCWS